MRCTLKAKELAQFIASALEEKKAEEIVVMDLIDVYDSADYFVICTGTSRRMLNSLMISVKEEVKKETGIFIKAEGTPAEGWVLGDYGDVIVHIFSKDQRENYELEDLWKEGKTILKIQ